MKTQLASHDAIAEEQEEEIEKLREEMLQLKGLHKEQALKITELTAMLKEKMNHIKELQFQIDHTILEKEEKEAQIRLLNEKIREHDKSMLDHIKRKNEWQSQVKGLKQQLVKEQLNFESFPNLVEIKPTKFRITIGAIHSKDDSLSSSPLSDDGESSVVPSTNQLNLRSLNNSQAKTRRRLLRKQSSLGKIETSSGLINNNLKAKPLAQKHDPGRRGSSIVHGRPLQFNKKNPSTKNPRSQRSPVGGEGGSMDALKSFQNFVNQTLKSGHAGKSSPPVTMPVGARSLKEVFESRRRQSAQAPL